MKTTTFDPNAWAAGINAVCEEAVQERCDLYCEIIDELRTVPIKSEDFFDRPTLAAVLSAIASIKAR